MAIEAVTGGAHSWYDIILLMLSGWLIPFIGTWYRDSRKDKQRLQDREDDDRKLRIAYEENERKVKLARDEADHRIVLARAEADHKANAEREELRQHINQQASVTRNQMTQQIGENTKISTDAFKEANDVNGKFLILTKAMMTMNDQMDRLQHQVSHLAEQMAEKVAAKVVETVVDGKKK